MCRLAHLIGIVIAALLISGPALAASVCIDPGHGGSDPGAVGCGLKEANINLNVSLKLRDLLQANGITTYMTRSTDVFVTLAARSAYANSKGATRFASIHANAGGGTGIETFCMSGSTSSSNGWKMAAAIQEQMLAVWPLPNRGVKTANFAVLRETAMPASLSELAFVDKCSPDAQYLGNEGHLEQAACAHFKAITSHLGLGGTCSTTPSTEGRAMGAVFEEKGSGTDDMTTRIPGATVTVQGANQTTDVSDPDALFSFSLESGTYTIEASMDGYASNTVSCSVTANQTHWCSIGLRKSDPQDPRDAGVSPVDPEPGTDSDAASDLPEQDAGSDDAMPDFPESDPMSPSFWEHDDDAGCACRTVPSSRFSLHGLWMLIGLALLVARRRRRRSPGFTAALAGLALLGCNQDQQAHSGSLGTDTQHLTNFTNPPSAPTRAPRLSSPQRILGSGYLFPTMSPDGQWMAVTRPGLDRLWLVSTANGQMTEVSRSPRSGYLPSWRRDSQVIGFRDGTGGTETLSWFVDLQVRKAPSFLATDAVSARQTEEDRILVRVDGREITIDEGKDKYFAPIVSHDGTWVVYTGITLGIHLYNVKLDRTIQLGQGTHPSLSADGKWLAFEKTDDDGDLLLSSDLYLCDLGDPAYPVFNLTRTPHVIERTPSLSSDGSRIAYVKSDGLYVAGVAW